MNRKEMLYQARLQAEVELSRRESRRTDPLQISAEHPLVKKELRELLKHEAVAEASFARRQRVDRALDMIDLALDVLGPVVKAIKDRTEMGKVRGGRRGVRRGRN